MNDRSRPRVSTTDLCDANEARLVDGSLQVLAPLVALGGRTDFAGTAVTLRLFEDNSLLADAVKTPGQGRVLVVDGGGSIRCAVLGGNLAQAAASNGWSAVIINGAVRDADEIDACDVAVRTLALNPRRSVKRGVGERDVPVVMPGATVRPGDWVYGDRDGVIVSAVPL
jgi:regulator of ribonuclease activity A